MIDKVTAYQSGDGALHTSLEEARKRDLELVFADMEQVNGQAAAIASRILDNQERILDILTTTSRSRPKRRKANGFRTSRGRKEAATANVAA